MYSIVETAKANPVWTAVSQARSSPYSPEERYGCMPERYTRCSNKWDGRKKKCITDTENKQFTECSQGQAPVSRRKEAADVPELSLDEINEEIAVSRAERKERKAART